MMRVVAQVVLAAGALCLVRPRAAWAEEGLAARFDVTRAPEAEDCPDAVALEAAISRLRGRDSQEEGSSDPGPAVSFEVTFARERKGYTGTFREGSTGAERTIVSKGSDCSALADAMTVAITMAMDAVKDVAAASTAAAAPVAPPPPWPPAEPEPTSPVADPTPYDALDESPPRAAMNVVFVEALGSGLGYSLNYERFFGDNASVRLGFSYVRGADNSTPAKDVQVSMPMLANYYVLGPDHDMHFGAGATVLVRSAPLQDSWYSPLNSLYGSSNPPNGNLLFNLVVGYRYVPRAGGWTVGADFMVLFNAVGVLPWIGVNLGAAF
jgi:hypothetical protein